MWVRANWIYITRDPNVPAYKQIARNLMCDMKKGDYAFFYHSNCKTPGVVGVMEIVLMCHQNTYPTSL